MRLTPPKWATMSGASAVQGAGNAATAFLATVVLGADERGLMVVVLTVGGLVGLLGGLGSGTAFRAALPAAVPAEARRLASAYGGISVFAVLVSAAVAPLVVALSAPLIDRRLDEPGMLVAAGTFAASQVLAAQANDAWFAGGRFGQGSVAAAVTSLAGLVSVGVLVLCSAFPPSARELLLAQAFGVLALALGQFVGLWRCSLVLTGRAPWPTVLALLRRGVPALGLTAGLALALRADRYLLGVFAGPTAVGIYSLAATLAEVPRLIPSALGQLFLRDMAKGSDRSTARRVFRGAVLSAGSGAAVVAGIGWVAIPWFGPSFLDARLLLLVLCAAEVCFASFFVATRGLVGLGRAPLAGLIGGGGAVVAVLGYSGGAAVAGGLGVAVASTALYTALAVVSSRVFRTAIDRRNAPGIAATAS